MPPFNVGLVVDDMLNRRCGTGLPPAVDDEQTAPLAFTHSIPSAVTDWPAGALEFMPRYWYPDRVLIMEQDAGVEPLAGL
jgi:hypothetical protein